LLEGKVHHAQKKISNPQLLVISPARGDDKCHLVVTAYPDHPSFFTSSGESSMVERQELYRKMNVLVRVHDDDLELEIATPAISQSEDPS
jgi:hypothetical protein